MNCELSSNRQNEFISLKFRQARYGGAGASVSVGYGLQSNHSAGRQRSLRLGHRLLRVLEEVVRLFRQLCNEVSFTFAPSTSSATFFLDLDRPTMAYGITSQKFLCCLPVRIGVFLLSFFEFLSAGAVAGLLWFGFVSKRELPQHPSLKNAVF